MTKVFITGDRSMDPITSVMVTASMLGRVIKKYGNDVELFTGAFETGVERAVRYLAPTAQVMLHSDLDNGKPDLANFHEIVKNTVDVAVLIHSDPLGSSIGKSLSTFFKDDSLIFV